MSGVLPPIKQPPPRKEKSFKLPQIKPPLLREEKSFELPPKKFKSANVTLLNARLTTIGTIIRKGAKISKNSPITEHIKQNIKMLLHEDGTILDDIETVVGKRNKIQQDENKNLTTFVDLLEQMNVILRNKVQEMEDQFKQDKIPIAQKFLNLLRRLLHLLASDKFATYVLEHVNSKNLDRNDKLLALDDILERFMEAQYYHYADTHNATMMIKIIEANQKEVDGFNKVCDAVVKAGIELHPHDFPQFMPSDGNFESWASALQNELTTYESCKSNSDDVTGRGLFMDLEKKCPSATILVQLGTSTSDITSAASDVTSASSDVQAMFLHVLCAVLQQHDKEMKSNMESAMTAVKNTEMKVRTEAEVQTRKAFKLSGDVVRQTVQINQLNRELTQVKVKALAVYKAVLDRQTIAIKTGNGEVEVKAFELYKAILDRQSIAIKVAHNKTFDVSMLVHKNIEDVDNQEKLTTSQQQIDASTASVKSEMTDVKVKALAVYKAVLDQQNTAVKTANSKTIDELDDISDSITYDKKEKLTTSQQQIDASKHRMEYEMTDVKVKALAVYKAVLDQQKTSVDNTVHQVSEDSKTVISHVQGTSLKTSTAAIDELTRTLNNQMAAVELHGFNVGVLCAAKAIHDNTHVMQLQDTTLTMVVHSDQVLKGRANVFDSFMNLQYQSVAAMNNNINAAAKEMVAAFKCLELYQLKSLVDRTNDILRAILDNFNNSSKKFKTFVEFNTFDVDLSAKICRHGLNLLQRKVILPQSGESEVDVDIDITSEEDLTKLDKLDKLDIHKLKEVIAKHMAIVKYSNGKTRKYANIINMLKDLLQPKYMRNSKN
jgi:small nuclear ribonucleoprotein (snRNP)-like protein